MGNPSSNNEGAGHRDQSSCVRDEDLAKHKIRH